MDTKFVPLGIENFQDVVESCYYVDKTKLIATLCDAPTGTAFLFTRPRRFGKSLAISAMKYFFSDEYSSKALFSDLSIAKLDNGEYLEEMNHYPVIHLNFKDIQAPTFERMMESMASLMCDAFTHFHLDEEGSFSEWEKADIAKVTQKSCDVVELSFSLKKLCDLLNKKKSHRVILLIDEYDAPVLSALENGYEPKATSFFKVFLGSALKGNNSLAKAVLSGVLQIAMASDFSGLNNLIVDNGFTEQEEYFAFTEEETKQLLEYYGFHGDMDEVRRHYGGYQLSEQECYCPWSALSFVRSGFHYGHYWGAASANRVLHYAQSDAAISAVSKLLSGESMYAYIKDPITAKELNEQSPFLSLLLRSGYLRGESSFIFGTRRLSIPNEDVRSALKEDVLQTYGHNQFDLLNALRSSFLEGKSKELENLLHEYVLSALSYFDFGQERSYQIMVMTLTSLLFDDATIRTEENVGEGRCDLSIIGGKQSDFVIIMEFKYCGLKTRNDNLRALAKEALKQIYDKDYLESARKAGKSQIICFGAAFAGKRVALESKVEELNPGK